MGKRSCNNVPSPQTRPMAAGNGSIRLIEAGKSVAQTAGESRFYEPFLASLGLVFFFLHCFIGFEAALSPSA